MRQRITARRVALPRRGRIGIDAASRVLRAWYQARAVSTPSDMAFNANLPWDVERELATALSAQSKMARK